MARQRRREFLATAAAVGAGLAGCAAPSDRGDLAAEPTAQFRVTPGRHGFRARRVPDSVERAWRLPGVNTGEHTAAKASPVGLPGGDVVVPRDTGVVSRVTPDGEVRWRAATDHAVRGIHGTPAVANGTVYVGAYDGALYAFDVETGVRRWKTKLGDAIGSSPLYRDGRLFVAVEYYAPSGSLFAVEADTGAVAWEDDRPTDHPHSSPALDVATGTLVVGANDGSLYAWNYPELTFAWRFPTGGPIKGPVATVDGAAIVGSWDHHVYRVDLATGTEEWRVRAGGKVMTGPGIDVGAGRAYVGSHDGTLSALDLATGEVDWSVETGGALIGCPAVTPGSVLVGSYDRHCYCVEASAGEVRWRVPATGWVTSTPHVGASGIYYTDRATEAQSGGLYRFVGA